MTPPLTDRIALVTGASRGLGRCVALELAKAGAHVVAVARTQGGLEDLDDAITAATGAGATLVPLDVKDGDGFDRLGAALYERYGRLDVLVCNAAILGPISPLGHVEVRHWDEVMAVNVTATWRVIRAMDPLLRAAPAARVVLVTSGVAQRAQAYWGPYAASKAAVDAIGRTYAAETETTPVRVNLFNPGPIRTKMRATAMPGEDPMTLKTPEGAAADLLPLCLPSFGETGLFYDYRDRTLKRFRQPAA